MVVERNPEEDDDSTSSTDTSLPDEFNPFVDGVFRPGAALVALLTATVAALVDTFYGGVAAIEAGIARLVTDPLYAVSSFFQDVVEALFGTSSGLTWDSATAQLELFGPLAYVAGAVVVAALLYLTTRAAGAVAGGGSDG